jgi:hypothetical protein
MRDHAVVLGLFILFTYDGNRRLLLAFHDLDAVQLGSCPTQVTISPVTRASYPSKPYEAPDGPP